MSTTSIAPAITVVVTPTAVDTTVTAIQPDKLKTAYSNKKPCAIFFKVKCPKEQVFDYGEYANLMVNQSLF